MSAPRSPGNGPGPEEAPVVGITTQHTHAIQGVPDTVPESYAMTKRFVRAPTRAGALPWIIPLLDPDRDTLRAVYERLDGIFLPGGADIDPAAYGGDPGEDAPATDPDRDRVELELTRWAREEGKPLLGVCRGMQAMNVEAGGTLYPDLRRQRPDSLRHDWLPRDGYGRDHLAHPVRVERNSVLARILGEESVRVNSLHHQGIRDVGEGLRPVARAPDGLIEGLEVPDHPFFVGVQWHPEELARGHPAMERLFRRFVEAAARFRRDRRGIGAAGG